MTEPASTAAPVQERVTSAFAARFGGEPEVVVRAPGRVNLIGEHTDYNDGFVLPMAIDRAIWIALRARDDSVVEIHSLDFDDEQTFDIARLHRGDAGWLEYIKGTAWTLVEAGYEPQGWEGVVAGDVPAGAGLSSSAALELATLRAFSVVSRIPWEPAAMARLGQKAENEWVGVNCGIMDQMISAAGKEGHALLIDCRTLDLRPVPLPDGVVVVIMDTATRRGLVESAYNERRRQCEEAARAFGARALRDVSLEDFEARAAELDPVTRRRARHVITENDRTLQAARVMQEGDARRLGQLMDASHESLRVDFEVSSDALDRIVCIARAQAGCFGARMTGAGFGGCGVALVDAGHADTFTATVTRAYQDETGLEPRLYVTGAHPGASSTP
jgi:galactokinase